MALSPLQTIGLTALGIGATALGANAIMKARERKRLQGQLGAPKCPEGLNAQLIDGEWQCLPVSVLEECLDGMYSGDRQPLPAAIANGLTENAAKTAEQFYGFHLSAAAMQQAWDQFMSQLPGHSEPEAVYYAALGGMMPCNWPLLGEGGQLPGFAPQPIAQLQGWPMDWNYYLEAPLGVSGRMEHAARSMMALWIVAMAQTMDQYLPIDVDPVSMISDPEVNACAAGDVLNMRAPGVPTSEKIIMSALTSAGYQPDANNVDQVMSALEAENPLLIEYLDAEWRISADMQDRMWDVLNQVGAFPRPVTNTVFNVATGSCPWDEKDRYTLSMGTLWYAAKRMAAIAELAGAMVPVIAKEGG